MPDDTVVEIGATGAPETSNAADGSEQPEVAEAVAGETQAEVAAKPEAAKAEAAKKDAEEKEKVRAARIAQQLVREKKFRDERLAWERERDQTKKAIEEERASFKQQVEKLQATRTTLDKFVKELRENPIQVLQEYFGIGPEQYYHRVMNNGKPDPNELTSRQMAELQKQLQEERDWRSNWEKSQKEREEAAKKAEEERRAAEAARMQEARKGEAQKQFFDIVKSNESKYSDLLIYPEKVILAQAERLVAQIQEEEGIEAVQNMTYEDLAGRLNESVAAWHAKVKGTQKAVETPAAPAAQEKPSKADDTDEIVAAVSKAESKKLEKVRRGNTRTATTLSGEMATRTTAKTQTKDWDEAKKRLVQELG